MEIGAYNIEIWEPASDSDGQEYYPVIIELFDDCDWIGKKRVYVRNTMTSSELRRLIQSNRFIVAQLFAMAKNQKVTLVQAVGIIKHI